METKSQTATVAANPDQKKKRPKWFPMEWSKHTSPVLFPRPQQYCSRNNYDPTALRADGTTVVMSRGEALEEAPTACTGPVWSCLCSGWQEILNANCNPPSFLILPFRVPRCRETPTSSDRWSVHSDLHRIRWFQEHTLPSHQFRHEELVQARAHLPE